MPRVTSDHDTSYNMRHVVTRHVMRQAAFEHGLERAEKAKCAD